MLLMVTLALFPVVCCLPNSDLIQRSGREAVSPRIGRRLHGSRRLHCKAPRHEVGAAGFRFHSSHPTIAFGGSLMSSNDVAWPPSLWAAVTPQGPVLPRLEGA